MPYSLEEFLSDLSAFREVNSPEWDVPERDWPRFNLTDTGATLVIPLNNVYSRTILYFLDKYGPDRGADNAFRFHSMLSFFGKCRERLAQERLVLNNPDDSFSIHTGFIRFLLDGFREPIPPVIFGQHTSASAVKGLSYQKVMRKWQLAKQQYAPDIG